MSESDDDWFDKDVDNMVKEIQKKKAETEFTTRDAGTTFHARRKSPFCPEQGSKVVIYARSHNLLLDYGGNYNLKVNSKAALRNKQLSQGGERYVQPASGKKLQYLSELEPIEVFLEVYQTDCGFFESLKESTSNTHIHLILKIMASLCELPFQEYGKDYLLKFINSNELFKQLEKVFKLSTDAVDKLVNISWRVESLGLCNENLEELLKNAQQSQYVNAIQKSALKNLREALADKREDYKEIYPSLDDIKDDQPSDIKPNIIRGKYASVEEYIHTHLSLLREDFVAPLREFILGLKACESIEQVATNRLYKATRFSLNENFKVNMAKSLTLVVDLNAKERTDDMVATKSSACINPKRLMYGTLLCFASSLNFCDLILAVISHRDTEMLAAGYVYVEILKMYNISSIFNRDFIMFESEVYFEPYHHVYRVLRGVRKQNFPMKNYIVDVEQSPRPPNYLDNPNKCYYRYEKHMFNPCDKATFPEHGALNMDSSQHAAFQQCLSQKFSLIQGPPGTGKTFLGLKVVATLLKNVDAQILIVCYTNHALDQFLSGVLESTTDIVRSGNQSRHELLDEYNIKQVADGGVAGSRNLKNVYFNAKLEYSKLIEQFAKLQAEIATSGNDKLYEDVWQTQKNLRCASTKLDELKQIFEYQLIKNKKVIGMTTTYASRKNLLLQLLKTPIVIVEEAAEILEPHIVATLTQSTEHVILIGDHQQLRPTTSVYRLSEKFQMGISLFERMVNNHINFVCLNTQHRMRPEIANLLRPTIYDSLKDAENVKMYPNVRGIAKNMFFIDHECQELKSEDETTKRNPHEAHFLLALANYLIMHDYQPSEIVILCTYNGQMFDLFNERRRYPRLEKVRITVVDNFQGEESKIILLSLVRNNTDNQIGYLAMKNRICVALSRAQEGFYVSGSIKFLARNNSTWNKIKGILEQQDAIGEELALLCKEDTKTIVKVRKAEDFELIIQEK